MHNCYLIFMIVSLFFLFLTSFNLKDDDEQESETLEPPKVQEYSFIEVRVSI
jgi:hypothetical protein